MSSPSGATRTPSTVLIEGLEHRAKCAVFDGLPDLCTCGAIGLSSFRQGWSPATHRDPAQMAPGSPAQRPLRFGPARNPRPMPWTRDRLAARGASKSYASASARVAEMGWSVSYDYARWPRPDFQSDLTGVQT